eukprot:scaffold9565_cov36-Phaeocystis_antarctica.AAC.1
MPPPLKLCTAGCTVGATAEAAVSEASGPRVSVCTPLSPKSGGELKRRIQLQIPESSSTPRRHKAAKTAENGQKSSWPYTRGGGKWLALVLGQSGRLLV